MSDCAAQVVAKARQELLSTAGCQEQQGDTAGAVAQLVGGIDQTESTAAAAA